MPGKAIIEAAGLSDVGLKRAHNEDSFILSDLAHPDRNEGPFVTEARSPSAALLVVADGMGGAAAGEVASRMAVEILREKLAELLANVRKIADLPQILSDASKEANAQIFAKGKANRALRGMGTTLTAALSVADCLFVLQVGDSRAYLLRRGKLIQVTRDQSLVGQMIYEGKMSAEDARAKLPKNVILQAVGKKEILDPVLTSVELCAGDRLLLCSDGLSNLVRDDEIESLMAAAVDLRQACQVMIDIAKDRGGDDNITVVLASFKGDSLAPPHDNDLGFDVVARRGEEPIFTGGEQGDDDAGEVLRRTARHDEPEEMAQIDDPGDRTIVRSPAATVKLGPASPAPPSLHLDVDEVLGPAKAGSRGRADADTETLPAQVADDITIVGDAAFIGHALKRALHEDRTEPIVLQAVSAEPPTEPTLVVAETAIEKPAIPSSGTEPPPVEDPEEILEYTDEEEDDSVLAQPPRFVNPQGVPVMEKTERYPMKNLVPEPPRPQPEAAPPEPEPEPEPEPAVVEPAVVEIVAAAPEPIVMEDEPFEILSPLPESAALREELPPAEPEPPRREPPQEPLQPIEFEPPRPSYEPVPAPARPAALVEPPSLSAILESALGSLEEMTSSSSGLESMTTPLPQLRSTGSISAQHDAFISSKAASMTSPMSVSPVVAAPAPAEAPKPQAAISPIVTSQIDALKKVQASLDDSGLFKRTTGAYTRKPGGLSRLIPVLGFVALLMIVGGSVLLLTRKSDTGTPSATTPVATETPARTETSSAHVTASPAATDTPSVAKTTLPPPVITPLATEALPTPTKETPAIETPRVTVKPPTPTPTKPVVPRLGDATPPAATTPGAPKLGALAVETTPAGAYIILDGEILGVTPMEVELELGRPQNLVIHLVGYADYHDKTYVQSEPKKRLAVKLEQKAP